MGARGSSAGGGDDDEFVSLLLCGTSAVGKSTILKNLQHICGDSSSAEEMAVAQFEMKRMAIETLCSMLSECIAKSVAPQASKAKIGSLAELTGKAAQFYAKFDQNDHEAKSRRPSLRKEYVDTQHIFREASSLWASPGMSEVFDSVKEWMETTPPFLQDSMIHIMTPKYFDKFAEDDFIMDNQDLLLVRRTTRGWSEHRFKFDQEFKTDADGNPSGTCLFSQDDPAAKALPSLKMIDVGGHASERASWHEHFTEELACIIYVVALDDYCKRLSKTNRKDALKTKLDDSLQTFNTLMEDTRLKDLPFVVCLNKHDELTKKISSHKKSYRLKKYYEDFSPKSKKREKVDEAMKYISDRYKKLYDKQRPNNEFRSYRCVAIDPKLTENVLVNVVDVTIREAIEGKGMA